jgi:hypothetical protein
MAKLMEHAKAGNCREELLIIYYAGHAVDSRPGDPPLWFAK